MVDRQEVQMTQRVPAWVPNYIALVAAKLGKKRWEIVVDAIRMHRSFFVSCGVIDDEGTA